MRQVQATTSPAQAGHVTRAGLEVGLHQELLCVRTQVQAEAVQPHNATPPPLPARWLLQCCLLMTFKCCLGLGCWLGLG